VPTTVVFVEQRLDCGALEPIGDWFRASQQDVATALAKECADQGADRHGKAAFLARDGRTQK